MIISVIGSGALGKAYGGILSLGGHEVHYLVRSEFEAIQERGAFILNFKETGQSFEIRNPRLHLNPGKLPPSDLIIIALKTTANKEIPSLIGACLKPDSIVLVMQNGIGNEEFISQFTKSSPLIAAISMMGAVRKNELEVDVVYLGHLKLAPFKEEYRPALDRVRETLETCHLDHELRHLERSQVKRKFLEHEPRHLDHELRHLERSQVKRKLLEHEPRHLERSQVKRKRTDVVERSHSTPTFPIETHQPQAHPLAQTHLESAFWCAVHHVR